MTTSPPRPPWPPEGPPRGTNFSRRKAMQPFPPSPAFTRILASSMNIGFSTCTVLMNCHPENPMLLEGPPAMRRACMRFHGSSAMISSQKKPRKSNLARNIPGGPSANIGPQDDRFKNGHYETTPRKQQGPEARGLASKQFSKSSQQLRFCRLHVHETAQIAAVDEANHSIHLRKQRIVLTAANVFAGLQTRAALTHDDRATANQLSSERLYSKPLRIRVAAVFGTT